MGFIFWIGVNWIVGFAIGKSKDRVVESVVASVLLGPIGWIIAVCLTAKGRKCPHCAEIVKEDARVCRFCGRALQGSPVAGRSGRLIAERYPVAKDGQQLGTFTRAEILQQLNGGTITESDFYFDYVSNDWMPIDLLLEANAR